MGVLPTSRFLRSSALQASRQYSLFFFALSSRFIYHLMLLIRHGSVFCPSQLVELFMSHLARSRHFCAIYSFFLPRSSCFFSFFTLTPAGAPCSFRKTPDCLLYSVDCFFAAAWWLERECSEMLGAAFTAKGDDRNLLLEYANVYRPLVRTFPSFGIFEVIYNSITRLLELRRCGLQQS